MPRHLHLLPWDRPLLSQAVEFLASGWSGEGPLDLSAVMVVLSTRQSGRRLREGLAAWASARDQAVFSPLVVLPESLVVRSGPEAGAASAPIQRENDRGFSRHWQLRRDFHGRNHLGHRPPG